MIRGYEDRNVYNLDETGLFFRAIPNKTYSLRNEKCTGGKMSKDRLTILFCVNLSGVKEKPLVIGKSARPRCFKNLVLDNLPVKWTFNKKAWMTTDIMQNWLISFDRKMRKENRQVLLFLDNAACHPNIKLQNVELAFLPPNTTAACQPLDQGIIHSFKMHYRSLVLQHLISKMDSTSSASELSKSINVLNAILWINEAWNEVSQNTVINCFTKSGFLKNNNCFEDDFDVEDDLPLSLLRNLRTNISVASTENVDAFDFVTCDNFLTITDIDPYDKEENNESLLIPVNDESSSSSEENCVESSTDDYRNALKNCESLEDFFFEIW